MSLSKHQCKYCKKPASIVRMIDGEWSKREYLCGHEECELKSRIKRTLDCRLNIELQEGT